MNGKKIFFSLFSFLMAAVVSSSCSEAENEYSNNQCFLAFNVSYHPDSRIVSAISSYETYAIVTMEPLNGRSYVLVTSIFGTADTRDNITTAEETQRYPILGVGGGLIIGRSSMYDLSIVAFDRQCPNCFSETGVTAAPLQWGENGHTVGCRKCGRTYNLAGDGVVASGAAGDKLMKYRAMFDGTYFRVQN